MTEKWNAIRNALILFGALLFFDWLIFHRIFLAIPNFLEWDTSPWYNFLYKTEKTHFDKNEKGILITGSSVALYSALPSQIDGIINSKKNRNVRTEFFSHVAMSPGDFYYYTDKIIASKPAIVFYILNPADLQLDHFREVDGKLIYSEKDRIEDYNKRYPVKVFYPFRYSKDNWKEISKNDIFGFLTKSFLNVNRYRGFLADPIDGYWERFHRKRRSFHNYTGMFPKEGIWSKGFTTQSFNVQCEIGAGQGKTESIYIPLPESKLTIEVQGGKKETMHFDKPGWYDIQILNSGNENQVSVAMIIDKVISSRVIENMNYGTEYQYGIRLSQDFCRKQPIEGNSYTRYKYLEDMRFQSMSESVYMEDYNSRLYKDWEKRHETLRMKYVRDKKGMIAKYSFFPWSELNLLVQAKKKLNASGIRMVIANSPENHRELLIYAESMWYQGLLQYYKNNFGDAVGGFYDFKDSIRDFRLFSDPHHLVWDGAELMSRIYAESILKELQ